MRPGDVVLDIGANFGQMSVEFSRAVGPTGKVYSFEADPFIHSVLDKNVKENLCDNITTYCWAVWNEEGVNLLYPEPDREKYECFGQYGIDPTADQGQQLISHTIDSLDLPRVDLIKIDIQGSDLRGMEGARATIDRCQPLIVFEFEWELMHKFGDTEQKYLDFISSINYHQINRIEKNVIIAPKPSHSG
jgi:FkbM family methyltransferase